ncbi:phage holin, lambda family [Salmonella enterica subsp. enterica]|nr:phage holin, lambda family [Salmonella enterica subsp. enterica serovar Colorado]EAS1882509.1 phage holin, lambda family [Salmonella enterica]EBF9479512.1 phage holin, lambda family [Salmonella enterica subsp. enterica serovar Nigeria]EBW2326119.1 phage holin, lambda family [Salmonella enterica subsp. enterica serovar Agoueve]EBW9542981.1 phage holin, lambda family [Salmonella enterica subsp. enterica serovar Mississippi]ECE6151121.1 phage holin, lambda family [Salmonella enterica subsp. en
MDGCRDMAENYISECYRKHPARYIQISTHSATVFHCVFFPARSRGGGLPGKYPDIWTPIIHWLYMNSPAALAAIVVALVRMLREGHAFSESLGESAMCGIITYITIGAMSYWGWTIDQTAWVGSVVGYLGVKKVDTIAKSITEKRLKKYEQ